MKVTKQQFDIFRKLCSRYKIKIDSVKICDLRNKLNPRHFRQFSLLKTVLVKINGKVVLRHNCIHRNPFIVEHDRVKKSKQLRKARKVTKKFFINYLKKRLSNLKKLEESERWGTGYSPIIPSNEARDSPDALFEICGSESNSSLVMPDHEDSLPFLGRDDESLKENQVLNNNVVGKPKFMDSLLSKLGKSENKVETSSPSVKLMGPLSSNMDFIESADSIEDFSEIEIKSEITEDLISYTKPQFPNQLSTPIVTRSRVNSAFLTADTDQEYLERIESMSRRQSLASSSEDDSKMKPMSVPPRLQAPERPGNMEKPRTVAEKKVLMMKKINDIRYRMVEQESKIYHQTQKKSTKNEINYALLDCLLVQNTPIKKDPWRALTWLRTTEGSYIYKMIRIDGQEYKLNGSVGNHSEKYIKNQSSRPFQRHRIIKKKKSRKLLCCQPIHITREFREGLLHNRQIRQCLRGVIDSSDEESIERKRTMDKFDSQISKMKPGPLSSKIAQINQIERNYSISGGGNLMSLPMPKVNLEFSWSPGKNLDPFVKQYLKALVPHRDLTPEWLDFALAPIKHNNKSKDGKLEKRSFSVQVPYATKNQIVVRKLEHPVARDLDLEEMCKQVGSYTLDKGCSLDDEMEWTFANNSDSTDELECEIVDIIKDLTNSTFINLNDDLFVKEESLFETPSRIEKKQEGSLVVDLTPKQKRVKCPTRMLRELRRLNGNFVTATNSTSYSNEPCANEFCAKGCVCQGFNYSHTNRCEVDADKAILSKDEVENLRFHANANLAKEEKDFRPTIILTESDSVFLQTNKSSRAKRVPKKYTDFLDDTDAGSLLDSKNAKKDKKEEESKTDPNKIEMSPKKANVPRVSIFGQKLSDEKELLKLGRRQINLEQEIEKMLHVNVGLRHLDDLYDIEPFCMFHHLYKCMCELNSLAGDPFEYNMDMHDVVSENQQKQYLESTNKKRNIPKNKNQSIDSPTKNKNKPVDSLNDPENLLQYSDKQPKKRDRSITPTHEYLPDDSSSSSSSSKRSRFLMPPIMPPAVKTPDIVSVTDTPDEPAICRRCLPVDTNFYKFKNTMPESAAGRSLGAPGETDKDPKFEIVNLADLINQGLGPIYINVYDAKVNKLNAILRAIINNDTALVYIDGNCFFVDRQFIDVDQVSFHSLMEDIENPIFILQKKNLAQPPKKSVGVSGSFLSLIHKHKSIVQVTNKVTLRDVNNVIEMILQNVKRKIEGQLHVVTDHMKVQLGMITRERTPSASSSSSSPLNVDVVEPFPRLRQSSQIAEFNQIFTRRMKTFCSILKSNNYKFKATKELQNKFHMVKWRAIIESFENEIVHIWQATVVKEAGEKSLMLALTHSKEPPKIQNADPEDVVNIRTLPIYDKYTAELSRMILLRMESPKTRNLVVLLYGCVDYFRICGMLNSEVDYLQGGYVARPSLETHPNLSEKIRKVHKVWLEFKEHQRKKITLPSETVTSSSIASEQAQPVASTSKSISSMEPPPSHQHLIKVRSAADRNNQPSTSSNSTLISPNKTFLSPTNSMVAPKFASNTMPKLQKFLQIKNPSTKSPTNPTIIQRIIPAKPSVQRPSLIQTKPPLIQVKPPQLRQITPKTSPNQGVIKRIIPGEKIVSQNSVYQVGPPGLKPQIKSKWCLFNITNDFSDIYIKKWKKYLSYGIIMNTIQRAKQKNRTILLTPAGNQQFPMPKIYALPSAPVNFSTQYEMTNNFLIFGPYPRDAQPDLLLMQNVDGTLMLRDEYEKLKKINRTLRTRCLWIFSDSLSEISNMMTSRALEINLQKKTKAKPDVDKNEGGLKISSIVGNYQEISEDDQIQEDLEEADADNSSGSSNPSPKLIINENSLETTGDEENSMDSDGAKKTLQQFQNKPWSSVVSNSNSPSISSTLNNAGVSNIPKIDDDKIKQEIMDVDSN